MPRRLRPERSVAKGWASGWRATVRGAAGVALFGAALVIGLISFTALTLAGGGPCYEHIAEKVDDDLGGAPTEAEMSWWRLLGRGLRDGVLLVLRSLMVTVLLLLAGFLPVIGQTVVAVLLTLVTAWFLALELVAVPFSRRGWDLKQRRKLLSTRRALALGCRRHTRDTAVRDPTSRHHRHARSLRGGVLLAHETLRITLRGAQPAVRSQSTPVGSSRLILGRSQ
jgi:CysZ protein